MKVVRNGLLLIDKPADMTSHDVVAQVRRILGQKSVGHTGTLDPLATGLMIMVLGEATKLSDYLIASNKSYSIKVKLGVTTDTLDRTGTVLREVDGRVDSAVLGREVAGLSGDFEWPIPLYSAAKIDGKKLCEYGREGIAIERPTKPMKFWDVKMLSKAESELEVSMTCSKGSFVRSWAAELGERLGVGACVEELRRLTVGPWEVGDALTLDALAEASDDLGAAFIPMNHALPGLKPVIAGPREMKLMTNGQIARDLVTRLIVEQKLAIEKQIPVFIKVLTGEGDLLAILAAEPGQGLKIRRVFRSLP